MHACIHAHMHTNIIIIITVVVVVLLLLLIIIIPPRVVQIISPRRHSLANLESACWEFLEDAPWSGAALYTVCYIISYHMYDTIHYI